MRLFGFLENMDHVGRAVSVSAIKLLTRLVYRPY